MLSLQSNDYLSVSYCYDDEGRLFLGKIIFSFFFILMAKKFLEGTEACTGCFEIHECRTASS